MLNPHPPSPCCCEVCPAQRSRDHRQLGQLAGQCPRQMPVARILSSGSTPQMPLRVGRHSAIMEARQRMVRTLGRAVPGWCWRQDSTPRILAVATQQLSSVTREMASYVHTDVPDLR
jgi:hypothetical protein